MCVCVCCLWIFIYICFYSRKLLDILSMKTMCNLISIIIYPSMIYIIHGILTATPEFLGVFLQNNNHQAIKKMK